MPNPDSTISEIPPHRPRNHRIRIIRRRLEGGDRNGEGGNDGHDSQEDESPVAQADRLPASTYAGHRACLRVLGWISFGNGYAGATELRATQPACPQSVTGTLRGC